MKPLLAILAIVTLPSCGALSNATIDDCFIGAGQLVAAPFVLASDAAKKNHHHPRTP